MLMLRSQVFGKVNVCVSWCEAGIRHPGGSASALLLSAKLSSPCDATDEPGSGWSSSPSCIFDPNIHSYTYRVSLSPAHQGEKGAEERWVSCRSESFATDTVLSVPLSLHLHLQLLLLFSLSVLSGMNRQRNSGCWEP